MKTLPPLTILCLTPNAEDCRVADSLTLPVLQDLSYTSLCATDVPSAINSVRHSHTLRTQPNMRIPVLQHGAHFYFIFISEFQPARNRVHSLSLRHGKGVGSGGLLRCLQGSHRSPDAWCYPEYFILRKL